MEKLTSQALRRLFGYKPGPTLASNLSNSTGNSAEIIRLEESDRVDGNGREYALDRGHRIGDEGEERKKNSFYDICEASQNDP